MKRTALALALILAGTGVAAAQGYGPRHNDGSYDRMQARGPRAVVVVPARHAVPAPAYLGRGRFHRGYGWQQPRRFGWYPRPWHRRWW